MNEDGSILLVTRMLEDDQKFYQRTLVGAAQEISCIVQYSALRGGE